MPIIPAGGGSVEYWEVFYYPASISRTGAPIEDKVLTVDANNQAAAQAQAEKVLGNTAVITSIDGPYGTKAQAQSAGKAAQKSQGQQNQSGHIPNPFNISWGLVASGFKEWFMRGLKILFGGVLMIVGISKLTGVENKVTELASKIKVVPV